MAQPSHDIGAVQDTRERIFRAAAQLFAQHGYAAVAMRQIAAAAGVSKPMLYYYFQSKQGLLEALLDAALDNMHRAMDGILAGPGSIEDRLRQITRMRFGFAREHPEVVKIYLDVLDDPGRRDMVARHFDRAVRGMGRVTGLIVQGQQDGLVRSGLDPWMVANALVGVTGIYMRLNLQRGLPALTDALADELFGLVMDGARSGGPPAHGGGAGGGDGDDRGSDHSSDHSSDLGGDDRGSDQF